MKNEVRERIIAAAWAILEKKGVAGTNAEDIAAQVGLSRSSFYRYFKGVNEVITEIAVDRAKHNLANALKKSRPYASSESLWIYFVFYAVQDALKDPLHIFFGEQNVLGAVDLIYQSNQEAFAQLTAIILPVLTEDQQRQQLQSSIPVELIAEWLLRQIWCLTSAPPPNGWTDASLLQCIRCFVVPGIMATQNKSLDPLRIVERLDRLQQSISVIETKIVGEKE